MQVPSKKQSSSGFLVAYPIAELRLENKIHAAILLMNLLSKKVATSTYRYKAVSSELPIIFWMK